MIALFMSLGLLLAFGSAALVARSMRWRRYSGPATGGARWGRRLVWSKGAGSRLSGQATARSADRRQPLLFDRGAL